MGNEYNRFHHHHHRRHQHHNLQMHHRSTFLPMLCSRPSIKDVSLPNCSASFKKTLCPQESAAWAKSREATKLMAFQPLTGSPSPIPSITAAPTAPTTTTTTISSIQSSKKLFSSKSLTPTTTTTITTTTKTNTRCRSQQVVVNASSGPRINGQDHHHLCVPDINIVDLDPPLPVIKRVHKKPEAQEEEVGSLWKRRSGGAALEGLQLKLTHHPRHQNQPTTV